MKITLTKVLSTVVVAYIIYQMFVFYQLFRPTECQPTKDACLPPMFKLEDTFKVDFFLQPVSTSAESEQKRLYSKKDVRLDEEFSQVVELAVPDYMKNNRSAILKVRLTPSRGNYRVEESINIGKYQPMGSNERHLLETKNSESSANTASSNDVNVTLLHMYKEMTVNVLSTSHNFFRFGLPMEVAPLLRPSDQQASSYLPVVYCNPMRLQKSNLVPVARHKSKDDRVLTQLNITLHWTPISLGKLRLFRILEQNMASMKKMGFTDKDVDEVMGIFLNTDLYFLLITIVVSTLHMLFDLLAFKNDVSFWRAAKDTTGLSGRTVMWRCFSSSIIFLYLLEEKTSLLVLVPMAIGTVIEYWKLTRVLKVNISWRGKITFDKLSATEESTHELDGRGMRYLAWVLLPLCVGSAIYSLLYVPHASWYSWSIKSLANCVYAFGFLFMTPQLFINYKLKSVAHLPWKALTYKAFNTFIDDFFAFIITMPTTHRLACFRDDIIFFIYLYQRWLYPVDKSRSNEFGRDFAEESKKKK